jgi:hypothetical protein
MTRRTWLFSAPIDLGVFVGSAALSLALLALVAVYAPDGDTPEWTWIAGVLLVDVAHVWSTAILVYLDPVERTRRPGLYTAVPLAGWLVGVALYSQGEAVFWRVLAYLAVFHFVRQQYGWVALYRARFGERSRAGVWIDGATIYLATLYPLAVWHAETRSFAWFRAGDFAAGLPAAVATALGVAYAIAAALYVGRAIAQAPTGVPWGKHAVVVTTAACWYLGIVATDSDVGFTVTNVFIHGVPYLALVLVYARAVAPSAPTSPASRLVRRGALPVLATLWAVAYAEELLWDRAVWHERGWLFGSAIDLSAWHGLLVPLLAVPQITHYVLDAFLWRRRSNPRLATALTPPARVPHTDASDRDRSRLC